MKAAYLAVLALLLILPLALAEETGSQTEQQTTAQSSTSGSSSQTETSTTTDSSSQTSGTDDSQTTSTETSGASSSSVSEGGGTQESTATQPIPPPDNRQACTPVTTLAADDAGNCQQFSNACLPPGWNPVDKCPEQNTVISPDQMPQGCKEVRDETGFVKVVCETKPMECPQYSEEEVKKCESNNGKPNFFTDQRGCKIFECRFQQESGKFMQEVKCPSEEERQTVSEKCKSNNMNPVIRRDYSGCNYVECVSSFKESPCPTSGDWERISRDCAKKRGITITDHDYQGCNIPRCELRAQGIGKSPENCINMPKEAFDKCRNEGGEMVVKEENGCITYAKCVMRGDERNVDYEEVEEMPQTSVLLSLAFKLERLKIEFDKLSKQTDDIANYYAASGDKSSEERFRKVSSMFIGANQKIDDIKNKMREHLSSLTKDDITDFKHDIKYIREVVIQDILYVMLSTEEATSIPASSEQAKEGCGDDGWCFNKALRTCEKTTFYPEGSSGPEIIIGGLEDKNCIIKASVSTPLGKKDMTCKYPNYVMGMERPEDLLPYCEGPMVEMVKQYGSGKPGTEPREEERISDRQAVPQRAIEHVSIETENAKE